MKNKVKLNLLSESLRKFESIFAKRHWVQPDLTCTHMRRQLPKKFLRCKIFSILPGEKCPNYYYYFYWMQSQLQKRKYIQCRFSEELKKKKSRISPNPREIGANIRHKCNEALENPYAVDEKPPQKRSHKHTSIQTI